MGLLSNIDAVLKLLLSLELETIAMQYFHLLIFLNSRLKELLLYMSMHTFLGGA